MDQLAVAGQEFSLWHMVFNADPVVKAVMAGLVLASIACWAIILEKIIRLRGFSSGLKRLERAAKDPTQAENPRGIVKTLLTAAHEEAEEGASRGEDRSDVRARLERAMRGALKMELQRIEVGLPFLATIGSAAPFIGLFGTVWGIMNSFTAIAHQKDTSLAVVAPGIAEALFATALGLAAAIPAVMAYNAIAVRLGRSSARASSTIAEIAKQISRPSHEHFPRSVASEPLRVGKAV